MTAANSNKCGYDQGNRLSFYHALVACKGNISNMEKCETDCSAAIAGIYKFLGVDVNPACTTRNIRSALLATGKFKAYSDSAHISSDQYAKKGGLYLKEGSHIVMAAENGSAYASPASPSKTKLPSDTASVQTWLNTCYSAGLSVDGIYGTKTKKALVKAWQTEAGGLTADGIFGAKSQAKAASKTIRSGSKGILVTIWQAYLVCRGYHPNGIDGIFGNGCRTATKKFQKENGLAQDGIVGKRTWTKAFAS